jgi:hypothetical protein
MPFVSITRLRLRSAWYLLPFIIHASRSSKQIVRNSKFIAGKTLMDRKLTFWTLTVWPSEADMRAYRNAEAHKKAMPRLQHWCDEAAIVHWQQEETTMPQWIEAARRMRTEGRISKVKYPSPDHGVLKFPDPRYPSKTERILAPKI